jgi:hypothetical protein
LSTNNVKAAEGGAPAGTDGWENAYVIAYAALGTFAVGAAKKLSERDVLMDIGNACSAFLSCCRREGPFNKAFSRELEDDSISITIPERVEVVGIKPQIDRLKRLATLTHWVMKYDFKRWVDGCTLCGRSCLPELRWDTRETGLNYLVRNKGKSGKGFTPRYAVKIRRPRYSDFSHLPSSVYRGTHPLGVPQYSEISREIFLEGVREAFSRGDGYYTRQLIRAINEEIEHAKPEVMFVTRHMNLNLAGEHADDSLEMPEGGMFAATEYAAVFTRLLGTDHIPIGSFRLFVPRRTGFAVRDDVEAGGGATRAILRRAVGAVSAASVLVKMGDGGASEPALLPADLEEAAEEVIAAAHKLEEALGRHGLRKRTVAAAAGKDEEE